MKALHFFSLLICVLVCSALPASAQTPVPTSTSKSPQHQTSAVLSPKCDEKKVRELAGDALVSIIKGDFGNNLVGFNVTLDTAKMDFAVLTKKMLDAGCF